MCKKKKDEDSRSVPVNLPFYNTKSLNSTEWCLEFTAF